MVKKELKKSMDWIKFLGTAGARFVMIKQLRASGGIWMHLKDNNVLVDPGPGSLVRCAGSRPRLDPTKLNAIILTHRHLDHSADINVMIEAMTEGGFKKRGILFCPKDCLDTDPIVLKHTRRFLGDIQVLEQNKEYNLPGLAFRTSKAHLHTAQTFGLKFSFDHKTLSLLSDTRYFEGIENEYKADVLIINVVFYQPRPGVDHLSLQDAKKIIKIAKPKVAVLTHFGMTMLKARPHIFVGRLSKELGRKIIAAYDGMSLELDKI